MCKHIEIKFTKKFNQFDLILHAASKKKTGRNCPVEFINISNKLARNAINCGTLILQQLDTNRIETIRWNRLNEFIYNVAEIGVCQNTRRYKIDFYAFSRFRLFILRFRYVKISRYL